MRHLSLIYHLSKKVGVKMTVNIKKEDLRITKSKLAIKQAFIELVETKGYDKVSVCDIAKKANINRNTFYLHYEDKDDLVKQTLYEAARKMENALGANELASFDEVNETQLKWGIRNLLRLIEPEMELYRIFLMDKYLGASFDFVNKIIKNSLIKMLRVNNPRSNMVFEYAYSGMIGVIQQWIVYSTMSSTEVARLLAKMCYTNLVQFRKIN